MLNMLLHDLVNYLNHLRCTKNTTAKNLAK